MTAILLRHASAGDPHDWDGDDRLRPLDRRGRKQAHRLVRALERFDLQHVVTSPYLRCVQTVEPLAVALGLAVELDDALAAGAGAAAASLLAGSEVTVACTHGDVVEQLLGFGLRKGAAVVVEPDGAGGLRAMNGRAAG